MIAVNRVTERVCGVEKTGGGLFASIVHAIGGRPGFIIPRVRGFVLPASAEMNSFRSSSRYVITHLEVRQLAIATPRFSTLKSLIKPRARGRRPRGVARAALPGIIALHCSANTLTFPIHEFCTLSLSLSLIDPVKVPREPKDEWRRV